MGSIGEDRRRSGCAGVDAGRVVVYCTRSTLQTWGVTPECGGAVVKCYTPFRPIAALLARC